MPRVIQRGEWGARAAKNGQAQVRWREGGVLWVHHTEGVEPSPAVPVDTEKSVMRGLQNFHQNTRGWSDIGYSYLIFPSGRIYEGRGWGVRGAHCPGHNDEPSVAFVGSFGDHLPTRSAREALLYVKSITKAGSYKGHRDGYSTSCPGSVLYGWLVNNPAGKPKPKPKPKPKLTVYERLLKAGFGAKSAKQILAKLGRTS